MNDQEQQPSPCPECGSERVSFQYSYEQYIEGGSNNSFPVQVVCCIKCGHTTQYANPDFVAEGLKMTAKRQKREQEELAARETRAI